MPQISLYIDEQTLSKVEDAAKEEHLSISGWVARQLRARLEPRYPAGFRDLFGSIPDTTFQTPGPPSGSDLPRESL